MGFYCANFGLPRPFRSRVRSRTWQTDRHHPSFHYAPPWGGTGIITHNSERIMKIELRSTKLRWKQKCTVFLSHSVTVYTEFEHFGIIHFWVTLQNNRQTDKQTDRGEHADQQCRCGYWQLLSSCNSQTPTSAALSCSSTSSSSSSSAHKQHSKR